MSVSPPPLDSVPPHASPALLQLARRARRSLDRFLAVEATSGVVLLLAALVAVVWANSPWAASYFRLWHTPVGVRLGGFVFERPLEWVINDGLMVLFFFVVGLEIRREIHGGELSEWRRAALPAIAAVGGMIAPALFYLALTSAGPARSGWGVPMATDIAFAVGVLALLGPRVPPALRVLLLALAVIDDLGAIVVIALFYSTGIQPWGLVVALAAFGGILLLQRFGVRSKRAYVIPGLIAWAGIYAAGIHPTIAGVLVGLMTPVTAWLGPRGFLAGLEQEVQALRQAPDEPSLHELGASMRHVDSARREAMAPVDSLIETLHPWVAFVVMPLFGLANAGVVVSAHGFGGVAGTVALACAAGLVVGKPVGILAACGLALRVKLCALPAGLHGKHLVVLGVTAGIGFTMSIFIAGLAFGDPTLLASAKLGVLAASGVAAVLALVLGRALLNPAAVAGAALSADEAESKTEA